MAYCVDCGSQISDGQTTCSMCYGDVAHGDDGYYMEWARNSMDDKEEQEETEETE